MKNRITERQTLDRFREVVGGGVPLYGEWERKITRYDGTVEVARFTNSLIAAGLNELAKLATGNAGSAIAYIAVGTVSAASSLGSTDFGEVLRKAGDVVTNSKEFAVVVVTIGGAADSVTSLVLRSGALCNHASSGLGQLFSITASVNATLAASDTLLLTGRIRIGSHNL